MMQLISLFISDTAFMNNLGLGRALVHADVYTRYLKSKNIPAGVHYYLSNEPACSQFTQELQVFTKQLGLLPALGISTVVWDNPDKWPACKLILYPKEHGLSPYALCKIDLNRNNSTKYQKVTEYSSLQLGETPLTINSFIEQGLSVSQIRSTLSSLSLRNETVPIENLTAIYKLYDMNYRQALLTQEATTQPTLTDKSVIGTYYRKLLEISESFDGGEIAESLDRAWRLFLFEQENTGFSTCNSTVNKTVNDWHLCYRYIVAAEIILNAQFPIIDHQAIGDELVEIPIQVDGKVRGKLEVTRSAFDDEEHLVQQALSVPNVSRHTSDSDIQSTHVIPFKIISIATTN
ncbi:MAG: hypothetical protein ABW139_06705 [Candidatus Thiodiazotropha sp. DIVDIV]